MALVKGSRAPVVSATAAPAVELSLPATGEAKSSELSDFTYLFYGERKIGKSTLMEQFPNPFMLMFEPGGRSLIARRRLVKSWEEATGYVKLLEKTPKYCDTVVLDNVNQFYEMCFSYKMRCYGIKHPKDMEGWDPTMVWKDIDKTFYDLNQRIFSLGKGVILSAHADLREVQRKDGSKYTKLTVQLGKQAFRLYAGIVDMIAYYQYADGGKRILTIRGDENLEAGCRMDEHFRYQDGTEIVDIPMGRSKQEAYKNFVAAFNNQLPKLKTTASVNADATTKRAPLKRA